MDFFFSSFLQASTCIYWIIFLGNNYKGSVMQHEENNFISFSLLHTNESVIFKYVESAAGQIYYYFSVNSFSEFVA